jgi:hypothetical protein
LIERSGSSRRGSGRWRPACRRFPREARWASPADQADGRSGQARRPPLNAASCYRGPHRMDTPLSPQDEGSPRRSAPADPSTTADDAPDPTTPLQTTCALAKLLLNDIASHASAAPKRRSSPGAYSAAVVVSMIAGRVCASNNLRALQKALLLGPRYRSISGIAIRAGVGPVPGRCPVKSEERPSRCTSTVSGYFSNTT